MWSFIWHTFFFDPVYNSLVFFIDVVPGGDVGIAIILTTVVVKIVLLPLSIKAVKTQHAMRAIEPELKALKEKYKDKREEQAKAMMELYRKAGVNPFASIGLVFLQIPIIIALYFSVFGIFSIDGETDVLTKSINTEILYAFIPEPTVISEFFLGKFNIAERSLILAALAGLTQFFHTRLAMPTLPKRKEDAEPNFKDDFARSMQLQMRYVMPVIIFVFAYSISAAIALYFTVSNLMSIGQEFIVKRHKTPLTEQKEAGAKTTPAL